MTSTSHSAYTVGYNVQSAVDTKHHLIVTHEVTNVGIDKDQLSSMAEQARDALNAETIEVLADKGYFNSEEIAACDAAGIDVYVPKPATSNSRAHGRFDKDEFIYDCENDHYVCPAGRQHLTRRMTRQAHSGKFVRFCSHLRIARETFPQNAFATSGLARNALRSPDAMSVATRSPLDIFRLTFVASCYRSMLRALSIAHLLNSEPAHA